ncbi:hydrolase [Deinococcus geothermalis]|uniref:hydrolase n=1 Tax=Deinococcus geothermalis TaxID=68909 RepID=UPI002356ED62|nr:hydrolase [Deinococcus geothermalis]
MLASNLAPPPAHDAWIQLYSGVAFDLLNPDPATIHPQDIAVALSRQPRFGGHTLRPYSVAQHSLVVAHLLQITGHGPAVVLQGLLHDATEAFVVDVPRPLKALLPEYRVIEDRVWRAVAARFDLPAELGPAVKWADEEALLHEAHHLLPGGPNGWGGVPELRAPAVLRLTMHEEQARAQFLRRLAELTGEVAA